MRFNSSPRWKTTGLLVATSGLVATTIGFLSCGHPGENNLAETQTLNASTYLTDPPDLRQVDMKVKNSPASYTPTAPPAANGTLEALQIQFDLEVNRTGWPDFLYDASKWTIVFVNVGTPLSDEQIAELTKGNDIDPGNQTYSVSTTPTSNSTETPSGDSYSVAVDLKATLDTDDVEVLKAFLTAAESTGRRSVKVDVKYAEGDEGKNTLTLNLPVWAVDEGVIRGAPTLTAVDSLDGGLRIRWTHPTDLVPVKQQDDDTIVALEGQTSTVSATGFIIWDVEKCRAEETWGFRASSGLNPESQEIRSCDYSQVPVTDSDGQCPLGCGADVPPGFAGIGLETLAEPARDQCYTLVSRPSTETETVFSQVENGRTYGVVAWAINSAGRVSLSRSACRFATPVETPLPPAGSAVRTTSDCFVVTAASGSPTSQAVQDWRYVRNRYLKDTSISDWYQINGPYMARWLNEHPSLKPPTHALLRAGGQAAVGLIYATDLLANTLQWVWTVVSDILGETAQAQEVNPDLSKANPLVDLDVRLVGGLAEMTTDSELWWHYYRLHEKPQKPKHIQLQVTGNPFPTRFGELGLGGGVSYFQVMGDVSSTNPNGSPVDPSVVGRKTVAYANGIFGLVAYRLPLFSWIALRPTILGGIDRLRLEGYRDPDSNNSDYKPTGFTLIKKTAAAQVSLDLYIGKLSQFDLAMSRMSYGLVDMGITAFYEVRKDYTGRDNEISLDSWQAGGGIVFLFQ